MGIPARVDIECITEEVTHMEIDGTETIHYGYPTYRATITVEFQDDVPERIMDIMRTGEL